MKFVLWSSFIIVVFMVVHMVNSKAFSAEETSNNVGSSVLLNPKEEAIDLLRRLTRAAKSNSVNSRGPCKYRKGTWSACDKATKLRTRSDVLKRGDPSVCEGIKLRSKECGKRGKKGMSRVNERT